MRAARLGTRGKAWWALLAAVIVVLAANAALAQWSRGSTSHGGGSTKASGVSEPSMVRARSVAAQEFGLLSGGGWAQAWALWSAAGQAAIGEADFARLNTQCRPALGEPYLVDTATDIDATHVSVAWHQGSKTGSSTMVFEGGAWKYQPDAQTLADYRQGVAAVAAERKAAGQCH